MDASSRAPHKVMAFWDIENMPMQNQQRPQALIGAVEEYLRKRLLLSHRDRFEIFASHNPRLNNRYCLSEREVDALNVSGVKLLDQGGKPGRGDAAIIKGVSNAIEDMERFGLRLGAVVVISSDSDFSACDVYDRCVRAGLFLLVIHRGIKPALKATQNAMKQFVNVEDLLLDVADGRGGAREPSHQPPVPTFHRPEPHHFSVGGQYTRPGPSEHPHFPPGGRPGPVFGSLPPGYPSPFPSTAAAAAAVAPPLTHPHAAGGGRGAAGPRASPAAAVVMGDIPGAAYTARPHQQPPVRHKHQPAPPPWRPPPPQPDAPPLASPTWGHSGDGSPASSTGPGTRAEASWSGGGAAASLPATAGAGSAADASWVTVGGGANRGGSRPRRGSADRSGSGGGSGGGTQGDVPAAPGLRIGPAVHARNGERFVMVSSLPREFSAIEVTSMFTSFGFMEGGKQNPRPVDNRDLKRLGIERKAYMLSFVPDGLLDMRSALLQWDGFVGLDDGDRPLVVREVGPDGVPLVHQPHAAAAAFADEIEAFAASAESVALDEPAFGAGATDSDAVGAKSVRGSQPVTDTPTAATGMTGATPATLSPSTLPLAAAPAFVAPSDAAYHHDHGDDEEKLDAPAAAPAPAPPTATGPRFLATDAEPDLQAVRPPNSSHDKGSGGGSRAPPLLTPEFLLGAGRALALLPGPMHAQDPPVPAHAVSSGWPPADVPPPPDAVAPTDDAREGPEGAVVSLPAAGCYFDSGDEEEEEEAEEKDGGLWPASGGPAAHGSNTSHDVVDDDAPTVSVERPGPAAAEPLRLAASSAAFAPVSPHPRPFAEADLMGAVLAAFASTAAQAAVAPAGNDNAGLGPARARVASMASSGLPAGLRSDAAASAPAVPVAAASSSGALAATTAAFGAPLAVPTPAPTIYDALSEMGPGNGVLCLAWGSRPHDTLVTELALKDAIAGQIADALTAASPRLVHVSRDDVWLVRPLRAPSGVLPAGVPAPSDGDSVSASVLVRVPVACAAAASALADARESWFLVDLAAADGAEYPCPVLFCDGFIPPEEGDSRE